MFVCCKDRTRGCNGVPDCRCSCSGCLDERGRFDYSREGLEIHDDTCDCSNCCGDDVEHEDGADDERSCSQCGSPNCTGTCVEEELEKQDEKND